MSLERRGIPTATFITHAFAAYAQGLCRMQGLEALPNIVIPHPIASEGCRSQPVRRCSVAYGLLLGGLMAMVGRRSQPLPLK